MANREFTQRAPQPIRTPKDNIREYIRTDIRIHCDTEPLLKNTLDKFEINSKEFKRLFAKKISKEEQKKKGFFGRKKAKEETKQKENVERPHYYLKSLVALHLNLIYNLAKSKDFLDNLQKVKEEQEELQTIEQKQPDLIQSLFNFDKLLTPTRALEFLQHLQQETDSIEEEFQAILEEHKHNNQKFLQQFEDIKHNLDEDLKNLGVVLTSKQLNQFTKNLGDFTP